MTVIDNVPERAKEKIVGYALQPLRKYLPVEVIEQFCRDAGYTWRERIYGPAVTLQACVFKHLHRVASARDVEDWIAGFLGEQKSGRDGHNFCHARKRLPLEVFSRACRHVGMQAHEKGARMYGGLRVLLVDGTTLRMTRTASNAKAFGHSKSLHGPSRLPLARMVWLVCSATAAVVDAAIGGFHQGEMRLFLQMAGNLTSGNLLVGDATYATFLSLWLLQERGCHALCHQLSFRRRDKVKQLGYRDELHRWERPSPGQSAFPEMLARAPREIHVRVIERTLQRRGYPPRTVVICTTLLDPKKYKAKDLIALYLKRWDIETDTRALKTTLAIARLKGMSADVVKKEIYSAMLAYNLARAAMQDSGGEIRRLSFERSLMLILRYSEKMSVAATIRLPGLQREMERLIKETQTAAQTRGPEPRCLIQWNTIYPVLSMTRRQWRKKNKAA